jgi:hypothetical protein
MELKTPGIYSLSLPDEGQHSVFMSDWYHLLQKPCIPLLLTREISTNLSRFSLREIKV